MCKNYFGAFSLATIRRAFHYVSIHKKNIEPQYRVAQYREEKTEVLQTGAYISATKKTKIHTYYGLDHDYKEKTKQKTTYCFIFCINFEFNYYDLYTLPVTFYYIISTFLEFILD